MAACLLLPPSPVEFVELPSPVEFVELPFIRELSTTSYDQTNVRLTSRSLGQQGGELNMELLLPQHAGDARDQTYEEDYLNRYFNQLNLDPKQYQKESGKQAKNKYTDTILHPSAIEYGAKLWWHLINHFEGTKEIKGDVQDFVKTLRTVTKIGHSTLHRTRETAFLIAYHCNRMVPPNYSWTMGGTVQEFLEEKNGWKRFYKYENVQIFISKLQANWDTLPSVIVSHGEFMRQLYEKLKKVKDIEATFIFPGLNKAMNTTLAIQCDASPKCAEDVASLEEKATVNPSHVNPTDNNAVQNMIKKVNTMGQSMPMKKLKMYGNGAILQLCKTKENDSISKQKIYIVRHFLTIGNFVQDNRTRT